MNVNVLRIAAACVALAAVAASPEAEPRLVSSLRSENPDVRLRARWEARDEYSALVRGAMDIVSQPTREHLPARFDSAKALAMDVLGDLRAAEAVPLLLDSLAYNTWSPVGWSGGPAVEPGPAASGPPDTKPGPAELPALSRYGGIQLFSRYPAAGSLVRIGKPASVAVLARLPTVEDDELELLMVQILRGVEGDELARYLIGQKLQTELKITSQPQRAARVQRAMDYLNELVDRGVGVQ